MARILKTIEIEGQPALALFDTGAVYTYVRSALFRGAPARLVTRSARVALGGKGIEIRELRLIEGLAFFADAVPVDDIGHAEGQKLDALIGALTMERWEIKLDPQNRRAGLGGAEAPGIYRIHGAAMKRALIRGE